MADRDKKILICDGLIQPTLYSLDSAACEGCTTRNPPGMPLSDDGRLREVHFQTLERNSQVSKCDWVLTGLSDPLLIPSLWSCIPRILYGRSSNSPAAAALQLVGQGRQTRNVVSAYQLELLRRLWVFLGFFDTGTLFFVWPRPPR